MDFHEFKKSYRRKTKRSKLSARSRTRKRSKYIKKRKDFIRMKRATNRTPIYSNPTGAGNFQQTLDAWTTLPGQFQGVVGIPAITEGVLEGDRKGNKILVHWFSLHSHFVPANLQVGGNVALTTAPYADMAVYAFECYAIRGQTGNQQVTVVANINAFFGGSTAAPLNAIIDASMGKGMSFDPKQTGFWIKRIKRIPIQGFVETGAGTYTQQYGKNNGGVSKCKWSYRNRVMQFDQDAHTGPQSQVPYYIFLNASPYNIIHAYTFKVVISDA